MKTKPVPSTKPAHRLKSVTVKYNAQVKPFQQLHVEFTADIDGLTEAQIDKKVRDLMDRILHYLRTGKEYINVVSARQVVPDPEDEWESFERHF